MPYEFTKFRNALIQNFKYSLITAIYEEPEYYVFYTVEHIVSLGKTRIVKSWTWNKKTKEIKGTVLD